MKNLLTITVCLAIGLSSYAQNRALIKKSLREKSSQVKFTKPVDGSETYIGQNMPVKSSNAFTEEEIGETIYDKQANRTTAHRTYLYEDSVTGVPLTIILMAIHGVIGLY